MARIAGVDLPPNKRLWVGLTSIYGIGQQRARNRWRESQRGPHQEDQGPDRRRATALRAAIDPKAASKAISAKRRR
jgi:ribosomal protein S13